MDTRGGLNITLDDNFEAFVPSGDGAPAELDLSSSGNVIDPKSLANEAAQAAANNKELEDEAKRAPLEIINETNKPQPDSDEEDEEEEEEVKPVGRSNSNEDEYQTFKVLGKHFADEGILDGYEEDMENTPEALQSMVSKTIEKGIEKYKESFKHPMAKQFLDFLENGGDPSNFVQMVSGPDYNSIDSDDIEGNTSIQKQLLRDQLAASGESQEDIEDMIESFEDAGLLHKRSVSALKKLQQAQIEKQKAVVESQKKAREEQIKKNQQILNDLKERIEKTDEIGGFQLTKKSKSDFYSYITEVDPKTGKTGLMADSSDPNNQLLMSYLYFNKFNFDKLGKNSKTEAAKSLQEKLGRFTDNSAKQKANRQTRAVKHEPGTLNLGPMKKLFG